MLKREFTADDTEIEKVRVIATKRGTYAAKTGVYHMDPKGKDPRARSRMVPPEVADELERRGLAKIGSGTVSATGAGDDSIHEATAQRRRDIVTDGMRRQGEVAQYFGASAAETRSTTAFDSNPAKAHRSLPTEALHSSDDGYNESDDDDDSMTRHATGLGTGDDGADGDDEDGNGDGSTGLQDDDPTRQEGNAGGGDGPPVGDGSTGQDQSTGSEGGDTSQPTETAAKPVKRAGRPPKNPPSGE